jgi:hypothetical protein
MGEATDSNDRYVYGVVRAGAEPAVSERGVGDRPVEFVTSGKLAAMVSDSGPQEVPASRRNLMAHSKVLQEAARAGCVLPMRFGVVMPGDAAVKEELLDLHEERLLTQLETFEHLVELELKVLCPEDHLLRMVVEERPEIVERRERLEGKPPEATYYERIELGELVSSAIAAKRDEVARRVVEPLEPLAVATEIGEPLHEQMVVNVALLVERAGLPEVDKVVEALGPKLGPEFRVRYVGPLPPYSFATLDDAAGAEAWA